ncbi:hypothetical protein KY386_00570 [Candidatus Parcubacteria bacterium]|nr:hypothetical protein [Candidatus Parcubacteria bacterium]
MPQAVPNETPSRLIVVIHAEARYRALTAEGKEQAGRAAQSLIALSGSWLLLSARDVWEQLTADVIYQAAQADGMQIRRRIVVGLGQDKPGTSILREINKHRAAGLDVLAVLSAQALEKLLSANFSYCLIRRHVTPGSLWELDLETGECQQVQVKEGANA